MVDVIWSDEALIQIDEIADYIAAYDTQAAEAVRMRLVRLGNGLTDFPNRGRPASGGTRELVTEPPHILRYLVRDDHVLILNVRHGARRPN